MPARSAASNSGRVAALGISLLEEGVDLGLVGHVPAREEGRKRHLGIDYELATAILGLVQEIDQALDHGLATVVALDRTKLRRADCEHA
jgi:hypothetical protein